MTITTLPLQSLLVPETHDRSSCRDLSQLEQLWLVLLALLLCLLLVQVASIVRTSCQLANSSSIIRQYTIVGDKHVTHLHFLLLPAISLLMILHAGTIQPFWVLWEKGAKNI